jgi:hypothetical protein
MWVWMCWINLGMFGFSYFMDKCWRMGCVGLDIAEGLDKQLMFLTNLFPGARRS